ncbi:S8 family serine peptidase [Blastopirellula sp. JC732]|uniref:tripeptidyl-peptidase II n=1 Tax=Blastopirellula sediminis TaxID=2894196 RepID=A0A9X1SF50_9BACT|nr:S8 family serine peptidase [Blastopirellula sediminis]MCC9607790.1 S8 family serine peptidase [Blastopirellula sediminis]MCC9627417.1 S8 family serine peptidase [Blastopirellula sediminis]
MILRSLLSIVIGSFLSVALLGEEAKFPSYGLMPKSEIGAIRFLEKHAEADGRGVVVAVFDTGVDPGAVGLQKTPDGRPKIIDMVDASGSGDVDTSTVRKPNEEGILEGLTGRQLTIPKKWKCPSGEYHVGMKRGYDLFPGGLVSRLKTERKKEWDEAFRAQQAKLSDEIEAFNAAHAKPTDEQKEELAELKTRQKELEKAHGAWDDPGPIYDCVVFFDGKMWRAVLDTDEDGKLDDQKLMTNFRAERQYATFDDEGLLNYALNIYDDGNILSVVTDCGTHGTHVAGIIAAYHPEHPEQNGIAPGAQIVAVKIGDTRVGSNSLGTGETRGMLAAIDNKVDLINMSYGGAAPIPNVGPLTELQNEVVYKHGIIWVASAGNDGPALTSVTAPGGTTSSIIGVGAYVSPELAEVSYSLRDKLEEVPYTWSSRGPASDGDLGVDICAPGGAIAPVSQWALTPKQLMNGTSMSSPNVCGGLAVLVSALKQDKIPYSPTLVKRAIQNSARALKDGSPFAMGQGLLQVDAAYDWLAENSHQIDARLRYDVKVTSHHNDRGIYLREAVDLATTTQAKIEVEPRFPEDVPSADKSSFEMKVRLECDAEWVKSPEVFFLAYGGRDFEIEVDPTALPPGAHYTEIRGYDADNQAAGPLFRVPITVTQTVKLKLKNTWQEKLKSSAGQVERRFINVPVGATWADLKISAGEFAGSRLMVAHTKQLLPQEDSRDQEERTYLRFVEGEVKNVSFAVVEGRTLELCLAHYWNSLGDAEFDCQLTFHSLDPVNQTIVFDGVDYAKRVEVVGAFGLEHLGPKAELSTWRRVVEPKKAELKPLSAERDQLSEERRNYGLTLTYDFTMAEEGEVSPRPSVMSDDSAFEIWSGRLWMIYDKNKQQMGVGVSGRSAKLPKGDYTLRLFLRHFDRESLEKLEGMPIFLDQDLKSKASLPVRQSFDQVMSGSGRLSGQKIADGEMEAFYLGRPSDSALPKTIGARDRFLGKIYFGEEQNQVAGAGRRPGGFELIYLPPPPAPKEEAATADKPKEKTLEEKMFDLQVAELSVLAKKKNKEQFDQLADKLLKESPDNFKVLQARLHMLDGDDRKAHLPAVVKAADKLIRLIPQNKLARYFGRKQDPKTEEEKERNTEMTNQKDVLTDALYRKCRAIAYMDLPDETDPNIEKSPADPEKRGELFEKTYQQLASWVDTTEEKYALVHDRRLRRKDRQGEALELLNKLIKQEPTKLILYKKRADIYGELGWTFLQKYENQWRLLRQNGDYAPF